MSISLCNDVIKEIAQNLEAGIQSWYHIPTGDILSAPDTMKHYVEDELWKDAFSEIETKMHECIAFKCLEPYEEFRIMESFAATEVKDKKLSAILINVLSNRKPFRHFKDIIDNSDYRQEWFSFRLQWYINYVQQELEFYNDSNKINDEK
jgi:Uncharacterised protein family (UPF0158)